MACHTLTVVRHDPGAVIFTRSEIDVVMTGTTGFGGGLDAKQALLQLEAEHSDFMGAN